MVGVVEATVSLGPEAGEDFQAVAAAVQANPMAVLLDSGCSHHLMGTKAVFVDMAPSEGVKHVRGFNGALHPVEGHRTVALQGEAGKRVLIPGVLYVLGVQANLQSAGQLKESGVRLKGDGDEMLLVGATGGVLSRALFTGLATGLDITPSTGADPPCVSCIGGKLARHTFPDKGSDADEALAVAKKSVLMLRSDRGGDFLGKEFTDFVDAKGIVHDLTCPYTPQQNGMAEREMRTAVESVRIMLGRQRRRGRLRTTKKHITKPQLRCTGRARRPPERLSFHACLPVYDEVDDDLLYDDAGEDEELPELDSDVHADPEHRWDIATMKVKEAMASWKGEAVKAIMEEEIRSLISMGTWELVERPHRVNIMKNWWVLMTKYRIDDTVEREKARLVMKGFTQVCGADYDERYSPVSSYVTLRIFLNIIAILDLNLMQLGMKNAFLQSKLDRVLYMYQPDYFDDGTGRVCKLLKSLYGLKQLPLLWYRALDGVLLGAGWKKSQQQRSDLLGAGL
ncbi:unnamed protein product, partial [Closterium sp. NIES-53]